MMSLQRLQTSQYFYNVVVNVPQTASGSRRPLTPVDVEAHAGSTATVSVGSGDVQRRFCSV